MTAGTLRQALAFADRGWPVLPCLPGQKIPATAHGHHDATTGERQITVWFASHPDWNLAIATGTPGPDVLDIDNHGPADNGYDAFRQLKDAGLLDGAAVYVRTPSGGLHAYFTGSNQRNGHLSGHHLDFRSAGGYVLTPPSQIDGHPYQVISRPGGQAGLDWAAVTRLLQPEPRRQQSRSPQASNRDLSGLARWVAAQPEGNRNAGLFWAANRVLDTDPAADLGELADAARQAGLPDPEITRTLNSARRTAGTHPRQPDHQAEAT
jgi:Bifunctional DNA primase/polymerase, N-terminal